MPAELDSPATTRRLAQLLRAAENTSAPGQPLDVELGCDGAALLRAARRRHVAGLLHRGFALGRISAAGSRDDAAFREGCNRAYLQTLRCNAHALEVGGAVFDALAFRGIQAAAIGAWPLVFGPAPVHPDPGLRPIEDIEVVVSPADARAAEDALGELGFRVVTRRPAADERERAFRDFHMQRDGVDLFVSLHWKWADAPRHRAGFAAAADFPLDGLCGPSDGGPDAVTVPSRSLDRVGALLVAATHAGRCQRDRWIGLVDVHHGVARGGVDWRGLARAARLWRVEAPVYAGLGGAGALLGTPVPTFALALLDPGPRLRRQVRHSEAAVRPVARRRLRGWATQLTSRKPFAETPSSSARARTGPEAWWQAARNAMLGEATSHDVDRSDREG